MFTESKCCVQWGSCLGLFLTLPSMYDKIPAGDIKMYREQDLFKEKEKMHTQERTGKGRGRRKTGRERENE